jgi:parvulin-like peptidyl-prolyl isomerase
MTRRLCLAALIGVGLAHLALAAPAPAKGDSGNKAAAASAKSATEAKVAAPVAKPGASGAVAAPETQAEVTYAFLKAPLFSEAFASSPVASVEDQVITLRDLTDAIAGAHGGHDAGEKAGKKDFTPILDRLIDARLIAFEAREMGMDELPEFKDALAEYRTNAAQQLLKEKVTEDVKSDPAEVERLYKDSVREWKVSSVLVDRAEYGKDIAAQLKAGKTFDAVVAQIVAEKKGKAGGPADFLPRSKMLPQVIAALSTVKVGELSTPVKVQDGFAVMRVEDVRYPDVPEARAQAESAALSIQKKAALTKYYTEAVKRYATIDKALLARLDFQAKRPGLDGLGKDQRAIARVQGAKPVTVADLTAALKAGFFHGVENAVQEKKLNKEKYGVFDGLLAQRILPLEVTRQRIDEGPELARRVRAWETSGLFAQVVQRVILPEVKAGEPEQRKFYEAHKSEYATPAMYRLESLVFRSAKEAQAAVNALRSGTDFKWLNANADGQVAASERKLRLEGVLAATTLSPDVAKALAGTKKGELRLYQEPETSLYHAVRVVDVVPAGHQTFEEVQPTLQQRVVGEAVGEAIHAYAAKLRKARDVKVYLTRIGA